VIKYNCSPKLDRTFKVPTRYDLLPIMKEAAPTILNAILTVDEMIERIALHVGNNFNIDVYRSVNPVVPPNEVEINAFYDQSKDQNSEIPIQIVLVTYPLDTMILWDAEMFDKVCKDIVDGIIHEVVHMKQSRARHFIDVITPYVEDATEAEEAKICLADLDEIDAYSYRIAGELLDAENVMQMFEQPSKITPATSPHLWAYLHTFEGDVQNPIMRRLLKKVYKNYQNLKK